MENRPMGFAATAWAVACGMLIAVAAARLVEALIHALVN